MVRRKKRPDGRASEAVKNRKIDAIHFEGPKNGHFFPARGEIGVFWTFQSELITMVCSVCVFNNYLFFMYGIYIFFFVFCLFLPTTRKRHRK